MKKKLFKLIYLLLLLLIISISFYIYLIRNGYSLLGGDISEDFFKKIKKSGDGSTSVFELIDDGKKLSTKEIRIDLVDFVELIKNMEDDKGLLFRPGIVSAESDEIIYTMMVSKDDTTRNVFDNMYLLDENLTDKNDLENKCVKYDPRYYQNYNLYVTSVEFIAPGKKASRFYSKNELIEMLTKRNILVYELDPEKYKNWSISIEGAALLDDDVAYLKQNMPTQIPDPYDWDYHKGFTIILRVKGVLSYHGAAYEIGKPCPPRCGD